MNMFRAAWDRVVCGGGSKDCSAFLPSCFRLLAARELHQISNVRSASEKHHGPLRRNFVVEMGLQVVLVVWLCELTSRDDHMTPRSSRV